MFYMMLSPVELVLVDDVEDVEDELSCDGVLVDESTAEVSDPTGAVVNSGWVAPPKLDAPEPPPQAQRPLVNIRAREMRMGTVSLAKTPADVT